MNPKNWLAAIIAWAFAPFATRPTYRMSNEDKTIDALNRRLVDLTERTTAIANKAEAEGRPMNDDELRLTNELYAEFESTQAEITARENMNRMQAIVSAPVMPQALPPDVVENANAAAAASRPVAAAPSPVAPQPRQPIVTAGTDRTFGSHGFSNAGEFFRNVARAGRVNAQPDPRLLRNAATTYGNEGSGADGGFAVPPDYRSGIQRMLVSEASLMGLCFEMPTDRNQIVMVDDPDTEYSTAGIYASWSGEGATLSQRKPNLKEMTIRLHPLSCLVPVTEELLEDATALASYVERKAAESMAFAVNDAIINGSGVGRPLGILKSAGLVSVAEESGQTADTINFQNLNKAYHRLLPNARPRSVLLAHPDAEEQFPFLSFPTSSGTVATPVYLPAGGASQSPYASMFGRRVIPTQACQVLGDVGDVIFADMSGYVIATKRGGIKQDVSIHCYFEQNIMAFRFIMRIGGQPWRNSTVAGYRNGTNARGFFSAVATRS